ncbi:hypothetical protein QR680_003733 [Steinernema hermaphroditum]|uniref:7TM GPCR serpentine receptor class x (Srx) domain-containing protein n=1 Tax=Steinernema hermaphroditum TaxID=289476 RepID=A0AA39HME2_9BILA|nr:hypothetical protein QR680_003733 [Steinernema hermaphroditum]
MWTLDNILIGMANLLLSLFGFIMNALLFMTLTKYKEFHRSTSRIIRSLCISCMMQLFVLSISSVMTMAQSVFNDTLDTVLGAIIQSGWDLYVGTTVTLALDRVLIFVWYKYDKFTILPTALLGCYWVFGLFCFVVYCFPRYHWSFASHYWWNYGRGSDSKVLSTEKYYDIISFSFVLLMYLFLFAYIARMRVSLTHKLSSLWSEIRIFIAAVVCFLFQTFYVTAAFWGLLHFRGNTNQIVVNLALTVEGAMFASVTMAVSSVLRKKAIEMIRGKKSVIVVTSLQS